MGHRITQRIYQCDKCNRIPDDGEYMWWMGNEVWCKDCCDTNEDENEDPEICIRCDESFLSQIATVTMKPNTGMSGPD